MKQGRGLADKSLLCFQTRRPATALSSDLPGLAGKRGNADWTPETGHV